MPLVSTEMLCSRQGPSSVSLLCPGEQQSSEPLPVLVDLTLQKATRQAGNKGVVLGGRRMKQDQGLLAALDGTAGRASLEEVAFGTSHVMIYEKHLPA